ncbi:MAG: DUF1801 domain-containing protein [Cyclobacteriaceae bacterium]|nr:DUF1801 domain-containing protein [Cyclobacteriaceae bacterium]
MKTRKKPETLRPGSEIVEEAMLRLPTPERVMMRRLRSLVQECLPKASELAYYGLGVPFYRHNRLICFLWPPSIGWGPKDSTKSRKPKGLTLGFCQGNLMSNEGGHLLAEGRKQIYCMYFNKPADIDEALVKSLLFEAGLIDETFAKKKRKR